MSDPGTSRKVVFKDGLLRDFLRQLEVEGDKKEEAGSWKNKPLQGMCNQQVEEVTYIRSSYQWLEKDCLKGSTEALIMAAQDLQRYGTITAERTIINLRPSILDT